MKLGIFAKTFKSCTEPDALFSAIQRHRLSYVHYNMVCSGLNELPLKISKYKLQEIRSLLNTCHLEIVGLSATFNMIHPDPEVRKTGLKSLEVLASAANSLGTDFLSVCTGSRDPDKWKWHPENNSKNAWLDLARTMEKAIEIAERRQVILGIEPEMGNVVRNASLASRFLSEMRSKHLAIILDPANLFEHIQSRQQVRDLIKESLEILHPHIRVVHAKDRALGGTILPAGSGDVDFQFLINQLKQSDFKGPLLLHGLEEHEVPAAVKYLEDLLAGDK